MPDEPPLVPHHFGWGDWVEVFGYAGAGLATDVPVAKVIGLTESPAGVPMVQVDWGTGLREVPEAWCRPFVPAPMDDPAALDEWLDA